jgi:hypothetical protein
MPSAIVDVGVESVDTRRLYIFAGAVPGNLVIQLRVLPRPELKNRASIA